jgi:hypothetical protein
VKRPHLNLQFSEEQQVILAVVLVVLLAISMLYCLGLTSLVVRHNWERAPLPWSGTELPAEELELLSSPIAVTPAPPASAPP